MSYFCVVSLELNNGFSLNFMYCIIVANDVGDFDLVFKVTTLSRSPSLKTVKSVFFELCGFSPQNCLETEKS